jgi:hypothetical protein
MHSGSILEKCCGTKYDRNNASHQLGNVKQPQLPYVKARQMLEEELLNDDWHHVKSFGQCMAFHPENSGHGKGMEKKKQ